MINFPRLFLPGLAIIIPALTSFAQVSISNDNAAADPSAMLDIKSSTMGVLIPRMTHTQMASIADPAEGLIVFCTDCGQGSFSVFIGGDWNAVNISCMNPSSPGAATHTATRTQITWNWSSVPYSTGYRWSADNDYATAADMGTATTMTEEGLTSNTVYTRYAWAYNTCGESAVTTLTQATDPPVVPSVTTSPVTDTGLTTATSGGDVTSDGDGLVTSRGVCWATSPSPDISGSHSADGTGTGVFTSSLTGLSEGTVYYLRAYATNAAGTSYGDEITFSTSVADIEGNVYRTVLIGTQLWLAENLRTAHYSDGTEITYHTGWFSTSPEYAWYDNNISYKDVYGALYNFPAVNTGLLCPAGWHVPTDAEYTTLTTSVGGMSVAGGKLKEVGYTHWIAPNTGATDEYGFTLRPAGATQQSSAGFISMGYAIVLWTSNRYITRYATNESAAAGRGEGYNDWVKNSVRCIKNP
jgi:uncharacterized protein (TIGR02145 family)